jgi:hypothetical protein
MAAPDTTPLPAPLRWTAWVAGLVVAGSLIAIPLGYERQVGSAYGGGFCAAVRTAEYGAQRVFDAAPSGRGAVCGNDGSPTAPEFPDGKIPTPASVLTGAKP